MFGDFLPKTLQRDFDVGLGRRFTLFIECRRFRSGDCFRPHLLCARKMSGRAHGEKYRK